MGRWRTNENDSALCRDHLGSVLALATPDGEIVESYEYEPYGLPTIYDDEGEIVASRTSAVGNRFMFTGREWEPDGEFYHYRYRTFSPHEKRFMQRDPIGLAGGWNVYAYCGGDPVNASDPMGLWPTKKIPSGPDPVHQASARRTLGPVLPTYLMHALTQSLLLADNPEYQTAGMSYRHAMCSPSDGRSAARIKTNTFVVDQIYKARQIWEHADHLEELASGYVARTGVPADPVVRSGIRAARQQAMFELGMAMHAVQDSTSPAHCGWQVWDDDGFNYLGNGFAHVASESFDPGPSSALDVATAKVWNAFLVPGPVPFEFVP